MPLNYNSTYSTYRQCQRSYDNMSDTQFERDEMDRRREEQEEIEPAFEDADRCFYG